MASYSLHKTNPRLAGNIKIVSDSKNNLFIESINSSEFLSRSMFKGFEYNENLEYGTNIRNFCSQLTNKDDIFDIYNESYLDVNDSLGQQYHQLYNYGCYSEESQLIEENLRFFAPLHLDVNEKDHPDYFVIFKVDSKEYEDLDFDNALSTWINKGELVHIQDLSKIKKLIFDQIKDSNIDIDFTENIGTIGLNLNTGLQNRTEEFSVDQLLDNETTLTEFENWITNSYKRHGLLYSNIINLEFAFTDHNTTNTFVRYVGMYVNRNDVSFDQLQKLENSGAIRLIEKENSIEKFDNSLVPEIYYKKHFSRFANSFGSRKNPIFEFNLIMKPQPGQEIKILFEDTIEHTIRFTKELIGSTVEETKENIIYQINREYQGSSTSIKATLVDKWIRLESNSSLIRFDKLRVELPSEFPVKSPIFSLIEYDNYFVGSGESTVILNEYINPHKFQHLMYFNDQGKEQFSRIIRVFKYKGDYLYELESPVNKTMDPDHIWFVEELITQPILGSILEHRSLDFDQNTSPYGDILDFDIQKFKDYLFAKLQDPDFIGDAVNYFELIDRSQLTSANIELYKNEVRKKLNNFFDSIDLHKEYLIKEIDLLTSESTTTDNEYKRLSEESNPILSKKNRLYQFINKWAYSIGKDVYQNPYRLNINLPFRHDGFSPSIKTIERDIRNHTHSWFILGEGRNPYLPINEDTVKKHLSYTKYPVEPSHLLDTEIDAFDLLKYETKQQTVTGWSDIFYDKSQDACYTFFRGVLYRFESNKLDGYRFAIILKGSNAVIDDVYKMNYYQNDSFKTLTMVIDFYIPDPILTSLENGNGDYYLDRSLLYFSNEIYTTSKTPIDFGTDDISLRLYDTSIPKTYLGKQVTNKWHYTTNNTDILWVGRGNSARFNISFLDLLNVGEDFEINYTLSEDSNSPFFGMIIRFEEIVEVAKDHFWCKRIIIKSNLTEDPDGVDDLDIGDNIVQEIKTYNVYEEFAANSNIFNDNNTIYISRAIAFENCIYDKIISPNANNARYKEISLSNIHNYLLNNAVRINGQDNWIKTTVLPPQDIQVLVKLWSKNGILTKLMNPYQFPMVRYSGKYKPMSKNIFLAKDLGDWKRIFPTDLANINEYKLNVSKNVNTPEHRVELYKDFIPCVELEDFYSYISAITGNNVARKLLPWIVYPKEHRHLCSLVFNSVEKISVSTNVSPVISVLDIMKDKVENWLNLKNIQLSDQVKIDFLRLFYEVTPETVSNFDINKLIVRHFIEGVFTQIYRVETIKTDLGQIIEFNRGEDFTMELLTIPQNATSLEITFVR
jgi:hypothetical protein